MKIVFSIPRSPSLELQQESPGRDCLAEPRSHAHLWTHPWGLDRPGLDSHTSGGGRARPPVCRNAWPGRLHYRRLGVSLGRRKQQMPLHLLRWIYSFSIFALSFLSYLYLRCNFDYYWSSFMVWSLPLVFPFGKWFQAFPEVACCLVFPPSVLSLLFFILSLVQGLVFIIHCVSWASGYTQPCRVSVCCFQSWLSSNVTSDGF